MCQTRAHLYIYQNTEINHCGQILTQMKTTIMLRLFIKFEWSFELRFCHQLY